VADAEQDQSPDRGTAQPDLEVQPRDGGGAEEHDDEVDLPVR